MKYIFQYILIIQYILKKYLFHYISRSIEIALLKYADSWRKEYTWTQNVVVTKPHIQSSCVPLKTLWSQFWPWRCCFNKLCLWFIECARICESPTINIGQQSQYPKSHERVAPVINICVDGIKHTVLVDTSCSWFLTSISVCHPWSRQEMDVLMANGKLPRIWGVASVILCVDDDNPINVLVVEIELLGFDLHFEMNIIKKLVGVYITELDEVRFCNPPICAAININEPNFSAEFTQHTRIWTASWKWLDEHLPEYLKKTVIWIPHV